MKEGHIVDDEKRTIDGYEVKNAVHIGDREILYAENLSKNEPYMVCNCQWDNPLNIEVYAEAIACTDYLEAMAEFLDRVSDQVRRVRDQRVERGVSDEPLTTADCIPGSRNAHYENQLVVIKPEAMIASARTADEQLYLATGGFGCDPDARGRAVYCKNLFTGKEERWNRSGIAGIIQPERIPGWAHQRLQDMGIAVEKPIEKPVEISNDLPKVYMASVAEARLNGELPAYRESLKLNRACAARIQEAINDSHTGNYHYDLPSALKAVTAEYGTERIQVVLANTVEFKDYDGRFSHDNKQWAKTIPLPYLPKERLADFVCEAHPAILDGFINRARKQEQEKERKPSVIKPLKAKAQKSHAKKNDAVKKTQKDEESL